MKQTTLITVLVMFMLTACDKKPSEKPFVPDPVIPRTGALPPGHPPLNTNDQTTASTVTSQAEQTQKATVVSALNIPQFTYLQVTQNNQTRWLATKTIAAKKGDVILFDEGSTMTNFSSKTLNRTFPSITFVNNATIANGK
jgi:hypothetical protein